MPSCTSRYLIILAAMTAAAPGWTEPTRTDCVEIEDTAARLACYDRLHGRSAAPPEGVAAAQESGSAAPESGGVAVPPPSGEPETLPHDRVVASGEGATGRRWFRLESGQLWQEVTPGPTDIATGDVVRITESAIGTFHLRRSDGSSRSSQVRRLQ